MANMLSGHALAYVLDSASMLLLHIKRVCYCTWRLYVLMYMPCIVAAIWRIS